MSQQMEQLRKYSIGLLGDSFSLEPPLHPHQYVSILSKMNYEFSHRVGLSAYGYQSWTYKVDQENIESCHQCHCPQTRIH